MAAGLAIPDPKKQVLPSAENLFKALLLIVLLGISFFAADRLAGAETPFKWMGIVSLAVVDVVLLTGMGALAHDAVHRVLFRSAFWNEFWGGLLSALTLIPFQANRQFHLTHHSYAHQPGLDPENAMHHHSFLYAATMGALIGLKEQYRLFLGNVLRGDRRGAWRATQDFFFLGLAATLYFGLVPALGLSVWATVVPTLIAFPPVFAFRALSDHYGIPAVASEAKKREEVFDTDEKGWQVDRDRVTGWVVLTSPWLEWLWSHVNYHEVHHKYPYLSHRYLPQVYAATRERYPYLVVRGYWRSLLNIRNRAYYSSPEEVRAFLVR
jgi:fatty acid desaturase